MRILTIHRLLSFLLACILLAQAAVAAAGWHMDFPSTTYHHSVEHCETMQRHLNTHHVGEQATVAEHHHCCHTATASVVVSVTAVLLPPAEPTTLTPTFSAEPYRNPLADLLIRPPIA